MIDCLEDGGIFIGSGMNWSKNKITKIKNQGEKEERRTNERTKKVRNRRKDEMRREKKERKERGEEIDTNIFHGAKILLGGLCKRFFKLGVLAEYMFQEFALLRIRSKVKDYLNHI